MHTLRTRKLNYAAWLGEESSAVYSGCNEDGYFSYTVGSSEEADQLWIEFQNSCCFRTDNRLVQLREERRRIQTQARKAGRG